MRESGRPIPMSRSRVLFILLCFGTLGPCVGRSRDRPVVAAPGPHGAAQVTLANGKKTMVPKERGQAGISDPQTAPDDRTVGWLVDYNIESLSYPISGTLIVWRAGKVLRRFGTEQVFYSWTFYAHGKQVAYHTGPTHGEQKSHCELHDVESGRRLAVWDGDLESSDRPDWTTGLNH